MDDLIRVHGWPESFVCQRIEGTDAPDARVDYVDGDVGGQFVQCDFFVALGSLDGIVDDLTDLLVNILSIKHKGPVKSLSIDLHVNASVSHLQFIGRGQIRGKDSLAEGSDGITCLANFLDFVSGTVRRTWIRHRVARVAIGGYFHAHRTFACGAVIDGEAETLSNGQNVHAVHLHNDKLVWSPLQLRKKGKRLTQMPET